MHDQATRLRQIAGRYRDAALATRPYVVTVTSGKGGVGKSTVALNLAIALADLGKRVLLLDADANLGGIDVMLGLSPRFRLGNVLRGEKDIEDVLIAPHPGLKVLPGNSGDADYPALTPQRQDQLLEDLLLLEEQYDLLMIDTAAGLTPEIVGFADHADETLVVSTVEPTAILDAYAMIKVILAGNSDAAISILLNSVQLPRDGSETARKLQMAITHFLKRDVTFLGSIPYDAAVHKSVIQQHPAVKLFPRSAVALSIRVLAQRFVEGSLNSTMRRVAS